MSKRNEHKISLCGFWGIFGVVVCLGFFGVFLGGCVWVFGGCYNIFS